jgi:hypothetical protein
VLDAHPGTDCGCTAACLNWLGGTPGGRVDPADLAGVIGARNDSSGRAVWRALNRLARYGLVYLDGDRVEVSRHVAPLARTVLWTWTAPSSRLT